MRHQVVELRDVRTGVRGNPAAGESWMRLADARTARVSLDYVTDGIGPRERGMVYRGGYCNTVNTVHDVFVLVVPPDRDPETGRFRPARAIWWEVAEESHDDHGRVRRHCTSWAYDRRQNQPLFMIGTPGSQGAVSAG